MEHHDWLEWRRHGLGGSDIAAILGVSPWKTAFDVWASKVMPLKTEDNRSMERGRRMEGMVATWASEDSGLKFRKARPVKGSRPWMRATPDGWLIPQDGPREGLEVKTAREMNSSWGESGSDVVPVYYALQCHWYMAITGASKWHLACFFPFSDDFRRYILEADPAITEHLIKVGKEWWNNHIRTNNAPEIDSSAGCASWLLHKYPSAGEVIRPSTPDETKLALELRDVSELLKGLNERKKELTAQIKATIGEDAGISGDWGRVKWSKFMTSRLDSKSLEKDHPGLIKSYKTEKAGDRLSPKWEKND